MSHGFDHGCRLSPGTTKQHEFQGLTHYLGRVMMNSVANVARFKFCYVRRAESSLRCKDGH